MLDFFLSCLTCGYPPLGTAQQAKTGLECGFARGLPDDDPDRDHGIFSVGLSIPMVGLVRVGEGTWVWGSGGAPEGRWSATRAYLGQTGELPRVNACAPLLALMVPIGMRALSHPPQPTKRRDLTLTSICRRSRL